MDGGRNGTRPGEFVSAPVLPGEMLLVTRDARLVWHSPDALRLIGSDGFGGIWYFDGLQTGRYRIQIVYENHSSMIGELESIWTGFAESPAFEVVIQ